MVSKMVVSELPVGSELIVDGVQVTVVEDRPGQPSIAVRTETPDGEEHFLCDDDPIYVLHVAPAVQIGPVIL